MNLLARLPRWARRLLYAGLVLVLLAFAGLLGGYFYIASRLPKVDTLADYRPAAITRILSDNGTVIAEIYDERRIVVPITRIPRRLIEAFIAAEDSNFRITSYNVCYTKLLRATLNHSAGQQVFDRGPADRHQVDAAVFVKVGVFGGNECFNRNNFV